MANLTGPIDYKVIFRQLPGNFLLIAPDGKILDDNDSHEAISLKNRDEIVGIDFFEAYPATSDNQADEIQKSHDHVRTHLEPHTMPLIRYDLERVNNGQKSFEVRYWEATHYPILDQNGELLYILQKTEDVTESHQKEQQVKVVKAKLEESEDRTRFIIESLPVMIWTTKPDGKVDYFNQRWLTYTGEDYQKQNDEKWADFVHEEDRQRVIAKWKEAVETKSDFQVEYRLRRKDGAYRWLLIRGIPRINSDGEVSMWIGGGIDIHDQKTMVQELVEVNEQQAELADQLQQSFEFAENQREMFFNIFMQAPAAISILRGPQHVFDFVNPGYQQLFPHKVLKGKPVAEALPEVVEQGFIDILDKVYNTGQTFFAKEIPIILERGDKKMHQCYFNVTYQQYKEGNETAGIAVFAFEVTNLVNSRQQLEKLTGISSGSETK